MCALQPARLAPWPFGLARWRRRPAARVPKRSQQREFSGACVVSFTLPFAPTSLHRVANFGWKIPPVVSASESKKKFEAPLWRVGHACRGFIAVLPGLSGQHFLALRVSTPSGTPRGLAFHFTSQKFWTAAVSDGRQVSVQGWTRRRMASRLSQRTRMQLVLAFDRRIKPYHRRTRSLAPHLHKAFRTTQESTMLTWTSISAPSLHADKHDLHLHSNRCPRHPTHPLHNPLP